MKLENLNVVTQIKNLSRYLAFLVTILEPDKLAV
tara:strand:+ start:89 stop:190 length:102 start_codon:yes stop_codon:yes gene_type:complete